MSKTVQFTPFSHATHYEGSVLPAGMKLFAKGRPVDLSKPQGELHSGVYELEDHAAEYLCRVFPGQFEVVSGKSAAATKATEDEERGKSAVTLGKEAAGVGPAAPVAPNPNKPAGG